jgi:hypothetical protein
MAEASQWLARLAEAATIHFTEDAPGTPRMWGSGFFVAPGLIVTCAHVLRAPLRNKPQAVFLVRGKGFQKGRPAKASMVDSLWPLANEGPIPEGLDLAVVRLENPDLPHECVWLADWSEQPAGTWRTIFGYVPERQDDGEGKGIFWSAYTQVLVTVGSYGRRFDESQVKFLPGLSGGPVLDPMAGAVVGVTKSRRPDGQPGGLAVATTALRQFDRRGGLYQEIVREHDKWHGSRGSELDDDWIGRQAVLPGAGGAYDSGTWTPGDRRAALGFLAGLPAPTRAGEVRRIVRSAFQRRWMDDSEVIPVAWRDGHGELYDGSVPQRAEHFLDYLDYVQRFAEHQGQGSRELADWIERRRVGVVRRGPVPLPAALLPQQGAGGGGYDEPRSYPGPGDDWPVIVLELIRLEGERLSYDWTLRGDGFPRYDGHAVPAEDLIHRVSIPLARLFKEFDLDEWPAPLEIALDLGEFDRPVHRWQVNQQANLHERELKDLLGVRRPVVLRQLDRPETADGAWSARWAATQAAPRLTARRVPARGRGLVPGQLAEFAAGEIPLLCRSAGDEIGTRALQEALTAGHGIALWHVDGHPGQRCREFCDELHAFTGREFARAHGAAELPDRLRQIREQISNSNQPHRAEGLALLYDDPSRPVSQEQGVLDSP